MTYQKRVRMSYSVYQYCVNREAKRSFITYLYKVVMFRAYYVLCTLQAISHIIDTYTVYTESVLCTNIL